MSYYHLMFISVLMLSRISSCGVNKIWSDLQIPAVEGIWRRKCPPKGLGDSTILWEPFCCSNELFLVICNNKQKVHKFYKLGIYNIISLIILQVVLHINILTYNTGICYSRSRMNVLIYLILFWHYEASCHMSAMCWLPEVTGSGMVN